MKYYVGLDLGGTNIAAGVVDENFAIVASHSVRTQKLNGFEMVVEDMAAAAREAIAKAGLGLGDIKSVGIGAPSAIHPKTKRVVFANNLGWKDAPLIEQLQKHIDKPVYLANDADCAAFGEALAGAAKGYRNAMVLTLGTGLGGGVIMNGRIFTGGNGTGCEPGHSTLVMDGVPCTCGKRGCFEAYASVTALVRQTIEMIAAHPYTLMREICGNDLSKISGRTAFEAAKRGDEAGKLVVGRYIYYLANGIASMVNVFRPDIVIVGGGICNEGEYLLEPVRDIVYDIILAQDTPPPIQKAALGNAAGVIGAALLETQEDI